MSARGTVDGAETAWAARVTRPLAAESHNSGCRQGFRRATTSDRAPSATSKLAEATPWASLENLMAEGWHAIPRTMRMNASAEVKRKNRTPAALEIRSIVKTMPMPM